MLASPVSPMGKPACEARSAAVACSVCSGLAWLAAVCWPEEASMLLPASGEAAPMPTAIG